MIDNEYLIRLFKVGVGLLIVYGLSRLFINYLIKNYVKERLKNSLSDDFEVKVVLRLPQFYKSIGYVGMAVFGFSLISMIVYPNESVDAFSITVISLFFLWGCGLVMAVTFFQLDLYRHENYFDYRTTFGFKHRVYYSDIKYYRVFRHELLIRTNYRFFMVDMMCMYHEYLIDMMRQHHVKRLEKQKKRR
jgi:hypothetical protein